MPTKSVEAVLEKEKQANDIISAALEEASALKEKARLDAQALEEKIILKAQEKADKMISDAQKKCAEISENAKKKAKDEEKKLYADADKIKEISVDIICKSFGEA